MKFFRYAYFLTFLFYIFLLITVTFFYPRRERISKIYEYHYIPLQSTIAQIKDPAQHNTPDYWRMFAISLSGNILLFIPLGFFLKFFTCNKNRIVLLHAFTISVSIELSQLIFHLGVCDIDDVILNSFGSWAGIALCCILHKNHFTLNNVRLNQL